MRIYLIIACVLGISLTGCASITGSENQSISVQTTDQKGSEVKGAACEFTNNKGKWFVSTPGSVMIRRSNDDMQVLCNKDGLDSGRAAVVSETKGSMFGNILFGGGIGAIIDHNKGTAYEYPTLIQVVMGVFRKIEVPKSADSAIQTSPSSMQVTSGSSTTPASQK